MFPHLPLPPPVPVHRFLPHSSSSCAVFPPYTKLQDQVTRPGSSHVNRTIRRSGEVFYFSIRSEKQILFWSSEGKQGIFFFAPVPQKVQIHNLPSTSSPSLAAGLFCRFQIGKPGNTFPKDVTLLQKEPQFQGSFRLIN